MDCMQSEHWGRIKKISKNTNKKCSKAKLSKFTKHKLKYRIQYHLNDTNWEFWYDKKKRGVANMFNNM